MTDSPALQDGARRHLDALHALHNDLSKRGGVIVLGGARGVGKGMLLAELRRALIAEKRTVLFGHAEQTAMHPYAALREPASQALTHLEARGAAERFLDDHARALGVLVAGLSAPQSGPRARDKTAFFEALRSFFVDLAREMPLSLLLSDLHYADDDTRDAVRFLAQHLFDPAYASVDGSDAFEGVLIVAARTDDDEGAQLVRTLCQGPRTRFFEVAGMSREELLGYISRHPHLDRLLAASRGRTEDVDELLEALPKDTTTLLRTRVASFPPVVRRVLDALAVLGRPAPPDFVAGALSVAPADVAHAMAFLVEQRLLARRLVNGELLFRFARPFHREVVLAQIDGGTSAALHRAVAAALEQRGAEGQEQLLAVHFLRGTDPARGVPYALRACERLLLTFAYGTAIDLAKSALPHADDDEKRFALLGHLVEAHRLRGELPLALEYAERMRAVARPAQLPTCLRRIGELLGLQGEHKRALDALSDAVARIDDDGSSTEEALPERALVRAAMAEVSYAKGDVADALLHAEQALTDAPQCPDAFRLRVSNTIGKVAYARERYDEAETLFFSNLRMAEDHGLDHEAVLARINTGLARHRRGNNEEAREILESALTSARAVDDIYNEAHALLNLGAIAQRMSDLGRSLEHYRRALALFSRMGNRAEVRRTTWNLANLYTALGDHDTARLHLEQSRQIAEAEDSNRGRAFVWFTEGDLAYDEGHAAAALTAYEKAREVFSTLGEASRVAEMTVKAAWAALALGDATHARVRVDELVVGAPGTLLGARRDAVHGAVLATTGGDEAQHGLALLSGAIDEFTRHRADEDAWRALMFLGERYAAGGDEPSATAARDRARTIVERSAQKLPEPLRARYIADHATRALARGKRVGVPVVEDVRPIDDTRLAAPIARRAEWDARYPEIVGNAPSLLRVFDRLDRIARTKQGTVLIRGESGTGKELVAAAVHRTSDRAAGPFVRVNCAALVETLLLSELFGHEKGSFTGALARKVGRFELARGGTIFLDEIGDISPKTQVSLLRVLQERTFERVGGTNTITTDAAVVCATHRDLEAMVQDGSFREDLYYRLKGVVVEVPALRERADDIPRLAMQFLLRARDEVGRAPSSLSPDAEAVLVRYRWPGNIRELQNVIRSVALFCEGDVVEIEHLGEFPELFSVVAARPAPVRQQPPTASLAPAAPLPASAPTQPPPAPLPVALPRAPAAAPVAPSSPTRDVLRRVEASSATGDGLPLGDLKRRLEFEAIANAMRQTGGNITRAAALLRMKRPRLSQIVNGNPELKAIKEQSRED